MNAQEKRLARLQSQRYSSPDYSSDKAMISANCDRRQAHHYKDAAYLALHQGDLPKAIYCTQVCLWIMRINKLIAPYEFKLPAKTDYIMPPNAQYDAECDRADRINDAEKTGEIA